MPPTHQSSPPSSLPLTLSPLRLPPLSSTTEPITSLATHILTSLHTNTQIPRISHSHKHITLDDRTAYTTSHHIAHLRSRNETPIGRKLGFTNRSIWPTYNVDRPNWNYIWDSTVVDLSPPTSPPATASAIPTIDISALSNLEPRIEPELVLGLSSKQTPTSSMSDAELLGCIEWMAPGFEIVISPFEGWVFDSAETTAAFALHGRLGVGRRVGVADVLAEGGGDGKEGIVKALETFTVELSRDGEVVDTGVGRNVLGSPIRALRWLVGELEKKGESVGRGEVITTGTLTGAWPVRCVKREEKGWVWEMKVNGLGGVDGLRCRFVC